MENMSKWKIVSYSSILLIVCVCAFLIAKYVVRDAIGDEEIPIDTSTRL